LQPSDYEAGLKMPYYITDKAADCSGWATTTEEGRVIGCHTTKQDAIDQMVAVSLAEDMEPGGERKVPDAVNGIEIRTFNAEFTEIRAMENGEGMTFGGYAWRYNQPSLPLPFTERIAPGAFTRTLKSKNDIRAYVNHDDRLLLGSTRAKTLRIEDRVDGGYVEIDLPNTTWGNDIRELVKRGDITGMSFGFSTVKDSWSPNGNERTLAEVRLHEVSVVTGVPAYPQTTASVRSWLVPAKRASVDADQLAAAIAELQAGNTLTAEQAAMLMNVIEAMQTSEDVPVDPANMDDVVAVEPITEIGYDGPMDGQQHGSEDIEVTASIPVSLLLKQIDLLAKSVNS